MSSLRRGHANLLCIVPILVYVLPKWALDFLFWISVILILNFGLPWWLSDKESACNSGDLGLIPELGRSLGEGNGYPFWYTCLGNPMDRGGWRGLQSMGSQIVGHDWATNTFTFEVLPTLMMFRWDCILCKMRTFTLDSVLCAWGHGDLGGDLAWPLSWKTPCLCLNVSA